MADLDNSRVISYPYQRDFLGDKIFSLRSLFWREIQTQKWAILYEGDFELLISTSQEPPPPILIWSKIPPKGPMKIQKNFFKNFEKFSRYSRFSKKTTSLQSPFWTNETKNYDKTRPNIVSRHVEPQNKEKKFMGWAHPTELLHAKPRGQFGDSVY